MACAVVEKEEASQQEEFATRQEELGAGTNLSSDLGSEIDGSLVDDLSKVGRERKRGCSTDSFDLVALCEEEREEGVSDASIETRRSSDGGRTHEF